MDKSLISQISNNDDSFIRRLIVAMSSFLFDKIRVLQIENGISNEITVPIFYSQTGEEQFLSDFFLDTDKYKRELGGDKLKGYLTTVPSGIMSISGFSINTQFLTSRHTRSNFKRRIYTPYGDVEKTISARTTFVPITTTFTIEIKASSDLQRLKITEQVIHTFYRTKKFKFSYNGYDSLPCSASFPTGYDMPKDLKWQYPSNDVSIRPRLKFNIETLSYMPSIDNTTERYVNNKMDNL